MADRSDGPLVARGSLVAWEREHRARLGVAEEDGELGRMRAEIEAPLRAELAAVEGERAAQVQALATARKALRDLRGSRGYRFMRRLGRWRSVERDIRKVIG
jgi:hypothetical protein